MGINLGQFVWKRVGDRRKNTRRTELRATITNLRGFLDAKLGDSANAATVLAQAMAEYDAAVTELAALSQPKPQTAKARRIPLLQRWFLLYTPSSSLAWFLHGLFFVLLGVLIIGGIATISDGTADSDSLIGFSVFAVLILIIGWGAAVVDAKTFTRQTGTILTVAIYFSLVINGFLLYGLALGDGDTASVQNLRNGLSIAVGGTILLVGVAGLCWYIRWRIRRNLALNPAAGPSGQTSGVTLN